MDCTVIIVSFNTPDLTLQTIRSVLASTQSLKLEIIVVDNNSHDDSVAAIRQEFGKQVKVLANADNVGFARANNQGMAVATGDYIWLLNSDTIVAKGALENLLKAASNHPEYGVLASSLNNLDGSYQPQGGSLPTLFNVWAWWMWPLPGMAPLVSPYQDSREANSTKEIVTRGWVAGTAMLIRRTVVEKIGGLDEKIFMYAEDVDYCQRAMTAGYAVGLVPSSKVTHLGSASGSSSKARLGEIKGLLYLFAKSKPRWQLLLLKVILTKGSLLRYCLFGILKGSDIQRGFYRDVIKTVWSESNQ